jgi:hypothetical protein
MRISGDGTLMVSQAVGVGKGAICMTCQLASRPAQRRRRLPH